MQNEVRDGNGLTPFINRDNVPVLRIGTLPARCVQDPFNGAFASLPWLSPIAGYIINCPAPGDRPRG